MKSRNKKSRLKIKSYINVLSSVALVSSILMPLTRPVESHAQLPIQKRVIDGGGEHSLAIGSDGNVYAWGYNWYGQLGDGTSGNYRTTPVKVQGLSNVVAIAGGDSHSLALTADGSVYAWGYNYYGQLGDGTTTNRSTPVKVQGLSNVVAIARGTFHSLALTADGSVYAWGYNGVGQLGDGTWSNQRTTPVKVQGLSNVVAIAAGEAHSLALTADGSVYAWGENRYGQLGDGTTTQRLTPVKVQGVSNVVAIATEYQHSLALTADGSIYAWGNNENGQLGDGTTTQRLTPVKVQGVSNVVAIAAGYYHSLALTADGSVYAWGYNYNGQLGDGTSGNYRPTPVKVNGLQADVNPDTPGDTTPPDIPVIYADTTTPTNENVTVTIDYPSDAATKEYRINGGEWVPYTSPIIMTDNGTIEARAIDQAGNVSQIASYEVTNIDKNAPQLPKVEVYPDKIILIPGNDNEGTASAFYRLNNGQWTPYDNPLALPDGVYDIQAKTVDKAGNESNIVNVKATLYGQQLAKVQELLRQAASSKDQADVDTAFAELESLPDNAPEKASLLEQLNQVQNEVAQNLVDEVLRNPTPENFEKALDSVNKVKDDTLKNQLQQQLQEVEDDIFPIPRNFDVSTTSPTNGDVTIAIDYPENATVKEYRINNGAWQPYTAPIVMTENGTVEARAIDSSGNVIMHKSYEVTNIDKVAPQLPKVEVYPDKVILTPGDDNGENTSIFYRVNNGAWTKYDNPLTLPDGVYDIQAKTVDEAGNESEVVDVKVVLYGEQLAKTQQAVNDAVSLKTQSAIDAALAELEALPDNAEEKASLLEQLDQVQNEVAQQLVNKAIQNPTPENIEEARQSVNKVKDETLKDQLQQQLQNLEDKMEIHAPAIKVTNGQITISNDSNNEGNYMILYRVNGGEWKEYKGDISLPDGNYVIEAKVVDQLGNESPVTSITTTIYAQQLDKAQQAVNQALSLKTQSAIDKAIAEVEKLPNSASEKAELLQQLDQLQNELAQQLVNEALQNPTQENIDKAKQAVEKVKDSTLKKQLQEQLKEIEDSLKMSKEAYLALKAIERAEKYTASSMVKYAYQKFNEVPENDPNKEMLRERLKQLQAKYDEISSNNQKSQAYKTAEVKVKALEIAYSPTLLRLAQDAVNVLPDGDDKDILQARIDNVVSLVQNSANAKKFEEAEKAVANAEKYKTDYYINKATELVAQLPDGETKQSLQHRLDALKQTPSEDEIAYQKALEAVQLANKYKIDYYKKKAIEAINLVKDENKKQELLQMLNV